MRTAFAAAILLGAAALTHAQPKEELVPREPPPRLGVKSRVKQYPQNTAKEALKSAVAAITDGDYPYLVAHLLDPKFVDDAITERARDFEPGAEAELAQLRDFQRANPNKVAPEDRVPLDPVGLRAMAAAKARERGYRQLLRDIQQKLTDDPQTVRDLRRIARDGSFADADPVSTATHPDVKGRALYFKKIGNRWFLENRQVEEPKKEP
jgi:hypothetical protein